MKKVTGIGGVFFKSENPKELNKWYEENLGIPMESHGSASFKSRELENPEKTEVTVWSLFPKDTKYFNPSQQNFMINYRVENLAELLKELKGKGIEQIGEVEEYDYGKFAWISDPEGNKIELWEPKDC
jgi:lactoylglutathione lyase